MTEKTSRNRFSGGRPLLAGGDADHNVAFLPASSPAIAAERSVIGALLAENDCYDVISDLIAARDFSDPDLRELYVSITKIISGQIKGLTMADPVTVAAIVSNTTGSIGIDRLQQLVDDAPVDAKSIASHARTVARNGAESRLNLGIDKIVKLSLDRKVALEDRVAEILSTASGVISESQQDVISIGEYATRAARRIVEHADRGTEIVGIATGINDLDALTSGLKGGQLIVVAGRPSMGKTAFAFGIASHAADLGHDVLVVSLEMGGEELATRVLSMKTGIDASRLQKGALSANEWNLLADATEQLESSPLHLVADASVKMNQLYSVARRMKREGRLSMLMIDYVQLMSPDANMARENRERQISEISRGLKRMAVEFDIPVIALAQLNRELEKRADKRPVPSDLRESGALEQDADLIIMLYRDEIYNPTSADCGTAEILLRKQRNGPVGVARAEFKNTTASFASAPISQNPNISMSHTKVATEGRTLKAR